MVDPARSAQMALIKARNTKPELRVRKALHATGLRYRLHVSTLPGKPDLVFPSRRAVVFVHGCFWHRHPGCANARLPKSRQHFWLPKLEANVRRDRKQRRQLTRDGWKVFVFWECQTRSRAELARLASKVRAWRAENGKHQTL